jgi:DNA-binding NarL/FixJ family response regulator
MTINALVTEDHPLMCDAICATLETDPDIFVLGTAINSDELQTLLAETQPDVLILDLALPGIDGLDILALLPESHPDLPVLIFSSSSEPRDIARAIQEGALGYLTKDASSTELLAAVHAVSQGQAYLPPSLSPSLVKGLHQLKQENERYLTELLTTREHQVLDLLATGKPNKTIAERLEISEHTVRTHLFNIREKVDADNRGQLILFARQHGLGDS